MSKKIIISVVIIVSIIAISLVVYYFTSMYRLGYINKYVLGNEVIVADNVKEDEEKYNEYIEDYNISGRINSAIDDDGVTIYNLEEKRIILSELPLPRKIIFYHKGVPYVFKYGTKEYDKIIELNNNRDTDNVKMHTYLMPIHGAISDLILNIDMLEYYYDENHSGYFNLDTYMFSGKKYNGYWVRPNIIGGLYVGLENPEELVKYLKSAISK